MFDLSGKIAVVTGGSRGIGRAIAERLAAQGAHVVVNYVSNEAAATETVDAIASAGGNAEALRFSVSEPQEVDDAMAGIAKRHGRLDILVNNAGVAIDQLLIRVKPDEVAKTFATNVEGSLWCARAAIRPMMRAKAGRILNLTSVVAESGNPGQAVYSASKAAIIGLTKTLAREYASRGITVNAIAPGYIKTDMTGTLSDEVKQMIVTQTPLARVGEVDEVSAAAVFLVSDEASYVTGQVLRVNGGMYM